MSSLHSISNWAGNQTFVPARIHHPDSLSALSTLVAGVTTAKVGGSLHSFNRSADTSADLILLDKLTEALPAVIDEVNGTAVVCAGMKYGELVLALASTKWALANMASLPHISIGGSIASATHGSGVRNGNLATSVIGLELVIADGRILSLDASHPDWEGVKIHLGALGAVTRVTLRLVPAFLVRQDVYEDLPFDTACAEFDDIMAAGYSVSLFTMWCGPVFEQVWRKTVVTDVQEHAMPLDWHGARLAKEEHHPIPGVSPAPCTSQLGVPGPWHARLPHFRMDFNPSAGEELQSEFFVSRADAPEALRAVSGLRERIAPILHITEIRTIAADSMWLSTAYGRDSVAIHFTWKAMTAEVEALLPHLQAVLAPFMARPHWGKVFAKDCTGGSLRSLYPQWDAFLRLRHTLDPTAKFGNAFLEEVGLLAVPQ